MLPKKETTTRGFLLLGAILKPTLNPYNNWANVWVRNPQRGELVVDFFIGAGGLCFPNVCVSTFVINCT